MSEDAIRFNDTAMKSAIFMLIHKDIFDFGEFGTHRLPVTQLTYNIRNAHTYNQSLIDEHE